MYGYVREHVVCVSQRCTNAGKETVVMDETPTPEERTAEFIVLSIFGRRV